MLGDEHLPVDSQGLPVEVTGAMKGALGRCVPGGWVVGRGVP